VVEFLAGSAARDGRIELCDWLKSLTPQQELALFMAHRGHILAKLKKDFSGALVAFSHAARLWPTSRSPLQEVAQALDQLWEKELAAHPDTYRKLYGPRVAGGGSAFGDALPPRPARPVDPLAEIEMVNEINRRNMQRMMPPVPTVGVPQPSPYGPQVPRPGVPNPYQPYQPPVPGHPPR
jgi:hypothetical protein